jgi:hypothetical protein
MANDPDDFDSICKLLAWKRHEQPPPGYFSRFSEKVIDRIQMADRENQTTWWQRFLLSFDGKPALVCVYGLLVCSGLLFGLSFAQMMESEVNSAALPGVNHWQTSGAPLAGSLAGSSPFIPAADTSTTVSAPIESASLLFNGAGLKVDRAGFLFGNSR